MAQDIFKIEVGKPVAWKLDGALLNFGDENNDLLAVGVDLSYQRSIAPTYPINSDMRILISGIPTGTVNITSVVGPVGDVKAFLDKFGDVCQVNSNVMTLRPGGINPCENNPDYKHLKLTLTGCLITSFGLTVNNQGGMGMVTSTISMSFVGLQAENTEAV